MTAAVYRGGTPSLAVPQTQNTAPVLEFNCLYTHDVRRKQKRWQDGFLRFHTFNKRVMVYDVPRNFIGDTHWKEDADLRDGDQVTLERDGVIVEVAESVGRTHTDLTELRQSTKKRSSEKGSSSPMKGTPNQHLPQLSNATTSKPRSEATQLKHRSLNTLLGTPKGPIGKAALPSKSPFEERAGDIENEQWDDCRPRKRQRMGEQAAWNKTRTTTSAKPFVKNNPPNRARHSDSPSREKKVPIETGKHKLGTKEVIDLSSDTNGPDKFLPGFSSDALAPPSSPPKQQAQAATRPLARSSSPAFQTQRAPDKDTLQQRNVDAERAGAGISRVSERRISFKRPAPPADVRHMRQRSNDLSKQRQSFANEPDTNQDNTTLDAQVQPQQSMRLPSSISGRALRMTVDAPKKRTLLCQDQLPKKPVRVHSANTENAVESLLDATKDDTIPAKPRPKSQRKQLQDRLARIRKKDANDAGGLSANGVDRAIDLPQLHEVQAILGHRPSTPPEEAASELTRLDPLIMPCPDREPPDSPVDPPATDRQLRRVVSESNNISSARPRRAPGAPVRMTPSPAKVPPPPAQAPRAERADPNQRALAVPPKARAKKPLQKSVSLNTTSNGTASVMLGRALQAPKPPATKVVQPEQRANPWSREAFDLFTWRPPGWDEERWCLRAEA